MQDISDLANAISKYLAPFSKEDLIDVKWLNKKISDKIQMPIPEKYLISYLHEKGFKNISTRKDSTKKKVIAARVLKEESSRKNMDIDDDLDFDPNEFLEKNKETIQNTLVPIKSFEDNSWLIEKYQNNKDINFLFEIVRKNIGLVEKVADRYKNSMKHDLDYEDLVSVGKFGLMKAIDRFDPSLGYQFSTYAMHWIRQQITRTIMDEGTTIRVPVHVHEQLMKLIKTENEIFRQYDELDIDMVCQQLGITREKYHELKKIDQNILRLSSLHSIVSTEGDDTNLIDLVEYTPLNIIGAEISDFQDPFEQVELHEVQDKVNEILSTLTDKEEQIIRLRFGFQKGRTHTLEEVGKVYGVTRERIRQIEAKTIRKIRSRMSRRNYKKEDMLVNL